MNLTSKSHVVKPGQHNLTELEEAVMEAARLRGSNGMAITIEMLQTLTECSPAEALQAVESLRKKGLLRIALPTAKPRWVTGWQWNQSLTASS